MVVTKWVNSKGRDFFISPGRQVSWALLAGLSFQTVIRDLQRSNDEKHILCAAMSDDMLTSSANSKKDVRHLIAASLSYSIARDTAV